MEHIVIFDRYADAVIGGRPQDFDAIEVQGVVCTDIGNGETEYMVDNVNPQLYSVYLHQPGEGVQCCGDFTEREQAQLYAAELAAEHGWPVHDFTHDLTPSDILS